MPDDERTRLLDESEDELSQVRDVLDHLDDDEWVAAALAGAVPILRVLS